MPTPPTRPKPSRTSLAEAFVHPGTFATTLVAMLLDEYGTEATTWDAATIQMEIEEDFKLKLPRANFDRLMAGVALLIGDDFYKVLPDFIAFCNIFGGSTYDPSTFDPADAEEVAWGITEALLISPPEPDDEEPFALEVVAYIGAVLDDEGIINPPDVLRIGLRESDPNATIQGEFSDDPTMFASIYEVESAKTSAINQSVRTMLDLLIQQLTTLDLAHGDARQLRASLQRSAATEEL